MESFGAMRGWEMYWALAPVALDLLKEGSNELDLPESGNPLLKPEEY